MRDGTETRLDSTETFPFPARFRRRATIRYWRDWGISGLTLAIAAFHPELTVYWRLLWLAAAAAFLWRARRYTRWYRTMSSVIEVNPFRIAWVSSDGTRQTISFADRPVCEDLPRDHAFVVRSASTAIPVSADPYLVGFNRLARLVEEYGAVVPAVVPPAS